MSPSWRPVCRSEVTLHQRQNAAKELFPRRSARERGRDGTKWPGSALTGNGRFWHL
jgi:hypothetical protein